MAKTIQNPLIGEVVRHVGWTLENNPNYPCDVLITDGSFLKNGRVSNFWSWRRILSDGNLAETEHGYGSFEESENSYKLQTKVFKIGNQ